MSIKSVKRIFVLLAVTLVIFCKSVIGDNGDTITVQTFTFGSPQDSWFLFPPDSISFRKILMYYTLKCNPDLTPYPCGEWDYITNTCLYEHTGLLDSNLLQHPNFISEGSSPDSLMYSYQPTWNYIPYFEQILVNTDTISLTHHQIGSGTIPVPVTLSGPDSKSVRTQFLWKAGELQAAGLTQGNITGMSFLLNQAGALSHLFVRIIGVTIDSLSQQTLELQSFTGAYYKNTTFVQGWNNLLFTNPYLWDGNSGVLIDLSYEPVNTPPVFEVLCDSAGFNAGYISSGKDHYLHFDGHDFIDINNDAFTGLDSAVTISFWQYGDPDVQPESSIIFQGTDSSGNRVLNVHCPWSNGNVYWDAGNNGGSYDRIYKAANTNDYEGKWNHWAFTKNVATGQMKIYLNGLLWHSGSNLTMMMSGIKNFKIGSGTDETNNYHGSIDEFSIWKTELTQPEIAGLMFSDIDTLNPVYQDLIACYHFNESNGNIVNDESQNDNTASMMGLPQWKKYKGHELFRNFEYTLLRPAVIFDQGVFVSGADSVFAVDSVENPGVTVVLYDDTLNPTSPTDTLYVYPPQYSCTFIVDSTGYLCDSVLLPSDSVLYLEIHYYYSDPYEVINRYELLRFITPYGINLDLGDDGFTWVYDITDYRPLLKDSVHLTAGNWQELLDIRFVMIKGTPPRQVLKLENVWNGNWYLSQFEGKVLPRTIQLDPQAQMFNLRVRTSGHGMGGASNCAEFCPKIHSLDIDGDTIYQWTMWKKCAMNPLYPQGGTWIYDRAAWCPGTEVDTYDKELTQFITPGSGEITIDYDCEFDPGGNYVVESQLFSYTAPSFNLDASIENIIAPDNRKINNRFNPACGRPVIMIRNTGSTALTSLKINYQVNTENSFTWEWTGNLSFLDTQKVYLPAMNYQDFINDTAGNFKVWLSEPNGSVDEYPDNNTLESEFLTVPVHTTQFILYLKTNYAASENSYNIYNSDGNSIHFAGNLSNNTLYKDTLNLLPGCYELVLHDTDDDGIDFWANDDGTGYFKLKKYLGSIIKTFEPDFGHEVRYQFIMNAPLLAFDENHRFCDISLFPNPNTGTFTISFALQGTQDFKIEITDIIGKTVYSGNLYKVTTGEYEISIGSQVPGIYMIRIKNPSIVYTEKLIIEN